MISNLTKEEFIKYVIINYTNKNKRLDTEVIIRLKELDVYGLFKEDVDEDT